jgi:hypothetical protein
MEAIKLLAAIKVWQLFFAVGVALIVLGLTGEVKDVQLTEGSEIPALAIGCVFIALSILLRMTPDPLDKVRSEISNAQYEFASGFKQWVLYEDVTHEVLNSDNDLSEGDKDIKISTLRTELAIHQKLLEIKIEDGKKYIRYTKT